MEADANNLDQIRQSFFSNHAYLEFLDGEYPVDCKCPMCGKTHRITMFWTGRGVPRKYCSRCKGGGDVVYRTSTPSAVGTKEDVLALGMRT